MKENIEVKTDLLSLLTRVKSIEEVVDFAEKLLDKPIIFLDNFSEKIHMAKKTKDNYLASHLKEKIDISDVKASILKIGNDENYLTREVLYLDKVLGYLIILEKDSRISHEDSEYLEPIANSLALIYMIENKDPINSWKVENEETIFEKLLFRRFNTIDNLDILSDLYTFRNYDLFHLGLMPINSEEKEAALNKFLSELEDLQIGFWKYKDKNSMTFMFAFNKNTISPNEFFRLVEKKIKQFKGLIVFGDPFSYILETEKQFNSIRELLFNKSSLHSREGMFFLDDYKFINFLSDLNPYINGTNNYISYKILDILKYDEKNNTDYAETLRVYLSQSQSPLKTSKILFVHKNTVIYRINKIKDLFNVDFTNADQCFQLYFSFQLLFTRGWKGRTRRD